ncbi:hypothetical protein ABKV19_008991 [Rosa sericea]
MEIGAASEPRRSWRIEAEWPEEKAAQLRKAEQMLQVPALLDEDGVTAGIPNNWARLNLRPSVLDRTLGGAGRVGQRRWDLGLKTKGSAGAAGVEVGGGLGLKTKGSAGAAGIRRGDDEKGEAQSEAECAGSDTRFLFFLLQSFESSSSLQRRRAGCSSR